MRQLPGGACASRRGGRRRTSGAVHASEDRSGAEERQLLREGQVRELDRAQAHRTLAARLVLCGGARGGGAQGVLVEAAPRDGAAVRAAVPFAARDPQRAQPVRGPGGGGGGGGGGGLELPEAREGEAEESAVEGAHPISHLANLRAAAAARRARARRARRLEGMADGAAAVPG